MIDAPKKILSLVGAGPGDPEHITLRAIKTLRDAGIVLYDALVSQEILDFIPAATPRLCVGKRAGKHSMTQEEINAMIVECAELYGHVVRLKGGDPFVFGRATEETEIAMAHGIAVNVVPGITSAIAAPAALQIPVTARGVSESFWVVTGTTIAGKMSDDIYLAAQSTATVVILMGLNKLPDIVRAYEGFGKGETPVAIIQNGTLPSQQAVIGTISSIVELARQEQIEAPAVIVVGEVVRYARDLHNQVATRLQKLNYW